jgi:hypothetical protein
MPRADVVTCRLTVLCTAFRTDTVDVALGESLAKARLELNSVSESILPITNWVDGSRNVTTK